MVEVAIETCGLDGWRAAAIDGGDAEPMRLLNERQIDPAQWRWWGDMHGRDDARCQRRMEIQTDDAGVGIMLRPARRAGRRDRGAGPVNPVGRGGGQMRQMPLLKRRRPEADG